MKSSKNNLINRLLGFFLLFLPVALYGQDARAILDQTSFRLSKMGGIKAVFTLQADGRQPVKGILCMKGNKFFLEAAGMQTWFDGRTQWSYVPANEEVTVSQPTAEELQSINPYTLLYIYKQGYGLTLGKTNRLRDKSVNEIVMTADNARQPLQHIVLYIDKATNLPLQIHTTGRGGEKTVVDIILCHTGQTYNDDFFTFDVQAHPDVEVIDLR